MRLLAIDPGKRHAGWAWFDDGRLDACGLAEGDHPAQVALAVADQAERRHHIQILICENQQVYGGRIKTDPNDLLPLAACVGGIRVLVPHTTFINPKPSEWKGTVPKDIFTTRIEAAMTPDERAILDAVKLTKKFRVDVLDAIGLGLWFHGRIGVPHSHRST
jgi:hypothetical protein